MNIESEARRGDTMAKPRRSTLPTAQVSAAAAAQLACMDEIAAIECVFSDVFRSLRVEHFSTEEMIEAAEDGEIPFEFLEHSMDCRTAMISKLEVANTFNVRRLDELAALAPTNILAASVHATKWEPARFGVDIAGVFADINTPGPDSPVTISSDNFYFAGSLWSLECKRYLSATTQQEIMAVYLRRRSLAGWVPPSKPGGAARGPLFEDTRTRTTIGFSIRLCGAPGAPTTNSVCGKSAAGKAFGCDEEQSWGWEAFLMHDTLTRRETWASGDHMRFVISLDMP